MYKLQFTLKQHTPLIHFQHDQDGATLRATEVKPKLDRFIIGTLGKDKVPKEWFVSDKHEALDYKLRIEPVIDVIKYAFAANLKDNEKEALTKKGIIGIDKSPFFADEENFKNKDYDKLRLGIFTKSDICLYISTYNKKLLDEVAKNIELFFILRNFGTRQSKGFGSFTLKETTETKCEELLKKYPNILKRGLGNANDFANIFKQISNTHRQLKSGEPATIEDSKFLAYLRNTNNDDDIEGDKRAIRDFFYKGNFVTNENSVFARALLGLAGSYSYPQNNIRIDTITIKDSENNIERFKTPYTFKVVGKTIFLIVNTIPDAMFDREFVFSSNITEDEKLRLKTPSKDSLKLIDFIKQYSGFQSLKS